VIFFFERQGKYTMFELVGGSPDGGCDLLVTAPDGTKTLEHFAGSTDANRRILELEASLRQAGWWGPVGRAV
jgi:hypothetical protein